MINLVKDGYKAVEVEYNESFYVNVNYKLGVKYFYSIFSVAFKERNGKPFWAPGFGFGSYFSLSEKTGVNIDAIGYMVNEDEWWTSETNQLNRLKVNAAYQITSHFAVYGGVSLNVLISGIEDDEGNVKGSALKTAHHFYKKVDSDHRIIIYPGINLGIRF